MKTIQSVLCVLAIALTTALGVAQPDPKGPPVPAAPPALPSGATAPVAGVASSNKLAQPTTPPAVPAPAPPSAAPASPRPTPSPAATTVAPPPPAVAPGVSTGQVAVPRPAAASTGAPPAIPSLPQPPLAGPPGIVSAALPAGSNAPVRVLPNRVPDLPPRILGPPAIPSPAAAAAAQAAAGAVPPPGPALAAPPAPGALPNLAGAIAPTSTNLAGLGPDSLLPKGSLTRLQTAPLEQVLQLYSELTGRIILRPGTLPAATITLDATAAELTKAEAIQAFDSVLTLNGITMIPVGEKFVTAVPSQQALQEGAAFSEMDPSLLPEAGQYLTKVVQLKYARPTEMQPLLQGFSKLQNGIMPIDTTQTLVLRDYAANIKRMMEIIEKVDVVVENDYKLEVIPIKYGKVEEIYSTMSSLIGGGGGGMVPGAGGAAGVTGIGRSRTTRGGGAAGSRSSRQGGLTGSRMGQMQQQGQVPGAAQPGAPGTFGQRLQQIVNRAAGMGDVQLLGDAKIVPDERSNSLIVFASKEDMVTITNIVSKVDRLLAQVLIEAIIMDVSISDSLSLGISAQMSPKKTGALTSVAGMGAGGTMLSAVTNFSSGPGPGFSYFGRYAGDMDLAVQALAKNNRGQVLETPRVQTSHAIAASFFTGQTVPYVSGTYFGGGYGSSSSFQQLEVGIGLNVTPYITPDGLVVMDIQQTIEDISGYTEIANVGKVPNTTRREATATVSVQDRDTIMLGGYIRTSKSKTRSGVPLLKDIPLLGGLFRSKSDDNDRSELIVLLRPTVLKTPHDAAIMATAERERLPGVREMEKSMHQEEQKRQDKADKATGTKRTTTEGGNPQAPAPERQPQGEP